jgi:glycosyltransferase involved in cell wall biosynthesis
MMRAIFVTATLGHGGAERHSVALMNRLAERGHECHAVYIKSDGAQLDRIRLRSHGTVRCLNAARYFDWRAVTEFTALISQIGPSVVVAANPYALMYSSLALRRSGAGAPLAVTYHTTLLTGAKEWLQMLYYRPVFWAADRLVFVCEAQRRHWLPRKVCARRNEVIYNGVDIEHWQPASAGERATVRASLGFAENDFVVGMCAVFRPEKNHVQLIDAIGALRRRGVGARALLIGDGVMRPAIEARARQVVVSDVVHITGLQQDVRPFLSACDAVVLCSDRVETFSLAALEAMALGRPVVHSDIGGAAEMIRPGENGFLFPIGDTEALVDRLARLFHHADRERMGRKARETIEARFSERVMVDRYERMLMELCRSYRSAEEAAVNRRYIC